MHIRETLAIICFFLNIWNGVVNYHLLMFVFSFQEYVIDLNVKVFIESLTKNINYEVDLSFISFNV